MKSINIKIMKVDLIYMVKILVIFYNISLKMYLIKFNNDFYQIILKLIYIFFYIIITYQCKNDADIAMPHNPLSCSDDERNNLTYPFSPHDDPQLFFTNQ